MQNVSFQKKSSGRDCTGHIDLLYCTTVPRHSVHLKALRAGHKAYCQSNGIGESHGALQGTAENKPSRPGESLPMQMPCKQNKEINEKWKMIQQFNSIKLEVESIWFNHWHGK